MILEDRRLKVREIVEAAGMSSEQAYHILSEELGMKKLSARWVPRLLMQDQKRVRLEIYEGCLACFWRNQQDFCASLGPQMKHRFTTVTLEAKQWKHVDSPLSKKTRTIKSATSPTTYKHYLEMIMTY